MLPLPDFGVLTLMSLAGRKGLTHVIVERQMLILSVHAKTIHTAVKDMRILWQIRATGHGSAGMVVCMFGLSLHTTLMTLRSSPHDHRNTWV